MKKTGLFFILCLFSLWSCTGPDGKESAISRMLTDDTLPQANGGILDIMVVCEDAVWADAPGLAFQEHFTGMVYGLPQPEPLYTVRQVNPKEFSDLLQRSRYIVLFDTEADSSALLYEYDKWARGQLVVNIQAAGLKDLHQAILKSNKLIDDKIEGLEAERLNKKLNPLTHTEFPEFFELHGLEMDIPKDFEVSVATDSVVVYWKTTTRSDNGIIIHVAPLPNEDAIIGNNIIPLRDSLTELYIPGSREGSYMVTEDLIKPQFNPKEVQGLFSLEARGLWRTKGDIMGGPFVSYTIYDDKNKRLIYMDTFIRAPQKKKRRSLFELESIIRSLRIL